MIVAFDLDDTLCVRFSEERGIEKYKTAVPIQKMIDICNECFDAGHHVVIYTARGMAQFSGAHDIIIDELYELTKNQLRDWRIKHHRLVMGKPHYDLLVDDKVLNAANVGSFDDIKSFLNEGKKDD